MEYLLILVFFTIISFYIDWKNNFRLYESRKERFIIPIIFLLLGTLWDSFAVYRGHWLFNFDNLLGIKLGLLPIEEYLFFLVVPYTTITFYKLLKKKI